ncbi:hypothetical protein HPB47_023594 [Ixodes persulcatus]|uniref:Uncharacterized protein n=1 Tax=Ixodes persulcatus TaxID=34615 RepID=A0AC60Q6L2_IXOPE|nr:hypothetical protein HPB47_023594 [Ixodes persulcatus]
MATAPIVLAENDTTESANTKAAGHLDNGQQPAEAGTSGKLVDGGKGNHDNSTSNDTSDSDMTTPGPEDQGDEDFISVKTRRKQKRKIESASDEESRIRKLVGIAVRAYEPRNSNTAVGIIRDVDASISEKVLLRNLSANTTKVTQEWWQKRTNNV